MASESVQGEVTDELKEFQETPLQDQCARVFATLFTPYLDDQGVPADQAIRLTKEIVNRGRSNKLN